MLRLSKMIFHVRWITLKTEQIIYLDDISKTHSITQTAQRFFISQQALSVSLTKLEEEFNVSLLERTNRGAELTVEGILFLEKARPILNIYKDLKDEISFNATPLDKALPVPEGALHIFCHSRVLEPLMVDLLEQYTEKYPLVQITLYEKENIKIIESIAQGQGDLGLIFTPDFLVNESPRHKDGYPLAENILIEKLFSDHFIVCCNRNNTLKNQKIVTMDSLQHVPCTRFDNNPYMLPLYQEDLPDTNSHQYFSNNTAFHKMMIRRNLAVSVITAFEFRKLYFKHKDLTALPISDSPESIINLVINKDRPLTPAAQIFINLLKNYDFYGV